MQDNARDSYMRDSDDNDNLIHRFSWDIDTLEAKPLCGEVNYYRMATQAYDCIECIELMDQIEAMVEGPIEVLV